MSDPAPNRLADPMPEPNTIGGVGPPRRSPRVSLPGRPSEPGPSPRRRPGRRSTGIVTFVIAGIWLLMAIGGAMTDTPADATPSPAGTPEGAPIAASSGYQAGQCLDVTDFDPEPGQEVSTVELEIQPSCASAHDGEVFMVADVATGSGAAYPRVVDFEQFADARCGSAFVSHLDLSTETGFPFEWTFMFPWEADWVAGDHAIVCYLVRFDREAWSGLARDAVVRPSAAP